MYQNSIGEVGKRLVLLKTGIENLTNKIRTHDQALFDNQGRHLKLDWTQFSHDCNFKFIEELRALHANIQQMVDKSKEAAERFKLIYGAREKSSTGVPRKTKKKNKKTNKKTKEKIFKRNVEKLFDQICTQEVREEYIAIGFLIPDCKFEVDREGYLRITKSKLKHLVCLLHHFTDEENHIEEGGSPGVRIDSDESRSEGDNISDTDSDQAADDSVQETVNKQQ